MSTPTAEDVAALFDGSRLLLARQLAGLRKSELAEVVGVSATALAAWESGRGRPTPANVRRISMKVGVEPGFFAARPDNGTGPTTPHFRSLRSTSQIVRDQARAYGQIAVDVASALEVHVELPAFNMPSVPVEVSASAADVLSGLAEAEVAARELREAWDIGPGPVPHLVRMAENNGILVVFSPPGAASVDAYSFDSANRPVVVLNPMKLDYYRQRFDMAHELGHLVMHRDADPGSKVVEDQAHRFASEFLLPAEDIYDELPTEMNKKAWLRLAQLKEEWRVSIAALLYRARTLGTLSDTSYRNAMIAMSSRGWRRSEPGLISSIEQPSLLPATIALLEDAGIGAESVRSQSRVPAPLFTTAVSRTPSRTVVPEPGEVSEKMARRVVSLLAPDSSGQPG